MARTTKPNPRNKRYLRSLLILRDGGRCVYCGAQDRLTIDHLIPASQGGRWCIEHCVLSCDWCNHYRGDSKEPLPFREDAHGAQQAWATILRERDRLRHLPEPWTIRQVLQQRGQI